MRTTKALIALSAGVVLMSGAAFAQQISAGRGELMTSVPTSSKTVTDWYKQPVYDKSDNKIGSIDDVLVDPNGQINAVIVGVGGVIGSEKDVAVNFSAIRPTTKNDKIYLTMETTQDALKSAPGFKYDSNKTSWVPDNSKK
jgi:sporulation protein YlmC with PRC-barrel domain